ncbi:zinc-binding dehydrogenase [Streptomyces niveus]|uniref:zinc-binding dehydrogenase n=1 Tax=Streptomyces niveus TaxID=193462 RepID=UPI003449D14A
MRRRSRTGPGRRIGCARSRRRACTRPPTSWAPTRPLTSPWNLCRTAPVSPPSQAGRLRVLVDDSYPLSEAAAAHRRIAVGHTTGKIVLVP